MKAAFQVIKLSKYFDMTVLDKKYFKKTIIISTQINDRKIFYFQSYTLNETFIREKNGRITHISVSH